ncbi:hypothetical protein DQ04_14891010, partial [Trypanosoma grayi]|uniref:hypothetical protein n=1 Tax=Trypanosoma grayi TaxID=71804 RepID=UPI0004F4BCC9
MLAKQHRLCSSALRMPLIRATLSRCCWVSCCGNTGLRLQAARASTHHEFPATKNVNDASQTPVKTEGAGEAAATVELLQRELEDTRQRLDRANSLIRHLVKLV